MEEYWTSQGSPAVIQIVEADNSAPILINTVNWMDAIVVDIFPTVEWEEGLEAITEHLIGEQGTNHFPSPFFKNNICRGSYQNKKP